MEQMIKKSMKKEKKKRKEGRSKEGRKVGKPLHPPALRYARISFTHPNSISELGDLRKMKKKRRKNRRKKKKRRKKKNPTSVNPKPSALKYARISFTHPNSISELGHPWRDSLKAYQGRATPTKTEC
ncbi:hypothetical protein SNE40_004277 [Patella caerulea]|uniref:Uncharacterized protein n=1 Tax=Patella caerulea TaxID=87958 RepID=A0AAN8KK41_PATCE